MNVSAVIILAPNENLRKDVVDKINRQCKEIIVVQGGSRGWARNEGLRKAKNNFVLMVDNDQLLSSNYVETLLANMNDVAVCSGLVLPHPTLRLMSKLEEYFKAIVSLNIKASGAGGNLYNRDLTLKVGGFQSHNEKLYDYDYKLFQELQSRYGTRFVADAIVLHIKEYTFRDLVKAGLTSTTTKNAPLKILFRRIFTTPITVLPKVKTLFSIHQERIIYFVPFYSVFRQILNFMCAFIRRFIE